MSETRVERPNFYNRGELLQPEQFRQAYMAVDRIFRLTDSPEVMSLGPSIVDAETAISDQWLESIDDYKPNLRVANLSGIKTLLYGEKIFNNASLLFKLGGNESADKKWLSDVNFYNDESELTYKFHSNGTIKMSRRSSTSRWTGQCWAHEPEGRELVHVLGAIKGDLHAQKVGQLALKV